MTDENNNNKIKQYQICRQVTAAADRPTQCSDSCSPCCTQMSMVSVINWLSRPHWLSN